jgi:3-deoxy-D-manno-octulosonic-acid transferase
MLVFLTSADPRTVRDVFSNQSMPINRTLYTLLWLVLFPVVVLRLLLLAIRDRGYASDICQRFGVFPGVGGEVTIWVHAVSVGETRAAQPLIEALQARIPGAAIVLTQTTPTGRMTARSLYGNRLTLAWLPWDLPWAQRAFLRAWRPTIGIILETELWPNLLAACERADVPVVLANARLSERSARRYSRLPGLTRSMLGRFRHVAAQTEADAARFRALGAKEVTVTGNLKFDIQPAPMLVQRGRGWRTQLGPRKVVLLASTRDGEEALLLAALLPRLAADTIVAIVPRHPQRFSQVASIIADMGQPVHRRSAGGVPGGAVRVWLGDSMGEMFAWYALADVAVIGGSWLPLGGQNLIEACVVGCPVVVGPHTFNFAQATDDAVAAGAALRAADAQDMASTVAALLDDDKRRQAMSAAGLAFAETHRGATARCMALIEPLLRSRIEGAAGGHR